jgi:hypothetical protein
MHDQKVALLPLLLEISFLKANLFYFSYDMDFCSILEDLQRHIRDQYQLLSAGNWND